jgi:glycosyltransferase involved in cell wall biosynthesis
MKDSARLDIFLRRKFALGSVFAAIDVEKLLIVAPRLPEYDRASGDLRLYRIIEILARRYEVVFFSDGLWERFLPEDKRYLHALESLGVRVLTEWSDLNRVCRRERFKSVVFEFYHRALAHQMMITRYQPQAVLVVDTVDVHYVRESLQAKTLLQESAWEKSEVTKADEAAVYAKVDFVWVVTEEDKRSVIALGVAANKIFIIPNIHSVDLNAPGRNQREDDSLLFIGGFAHEPNQDAIVYFCKEILPFVENQVPHVRLRIVGDKVPVAVRDLATTNIKVTGFVPDTKPFLNGSMVSVAPLRFGAGLKGKVTEALTAGIPLVSTTVGVQGLNVSSWRECVIEDNPADFAKSVVRVLREPQIWRELSRNGQEFMNQHFGYERVARDLLEFFGNCPEATQRGSTATAIAGIKRAIAQRFF